MINDPAAVAWLEDQFEKQFRPGGGQRVDVGSSELNAPLHLAHEGERGEVTTDDTGTVETFPPMAAIRHRIRSLLGRR